MSADATPLVILDRDGVINVDRVDYVRRLEEWQPLPGSLEAIAQLSRAGITVAVATNQSGIGRGVYELSSLQQIHELLQRQVEALGGRIAHIAFCPHAPEHGCSCRKPAPGMLEEISRQLGLPLRRVPYVGDALRDLQAARAAGAQPVLVRTGKGATTETELPAAWGVPVHADLAAFVASHLRHLGS